MSYRNRICLFIISNWKQNWKIIIPLYLLRLDKLTSHVYIPLSLMDILYSTSQWYPFKMAIFSYSLLILDLVFIQQSVG